MVGTVIFRCSACGEGSLFQSDVTKHHVDMHPDIQPLRFWRDETVSGGAIYQLDGADLSLVLLKNYKPFCKVHGAMNQVSRDGLWRCISSGGNCRAGCIVKTEALKEGDRV